MENNKLILNVDWKETKILSLDRFVSWCFSSTNGFPAMLKIVPGADTQIHSDILCACAVNRHPVPLGRVRQTPDASWEFVWGCRASAAAHQRLQVWCSQLRGGCSCRCRRSGGRKQAGSQKDTLGFCCLLSFINAWPGFGLVCPDLEHLAWCGMHMFVLLPRNHHFIPFL